MIKRKDVIRIKIPFPNVSSTLAVQSHMYICRSNIDDELILVKCQTKRIDIVLRHVMKHYWDEKPDLSRNPFVQPTRIDCDKVFSVPTSSCSDDMKTHRRPDICDDVMDHVEQELSEDGHDTIQFSKEEFESVNDMYIV